ncbi:MAG: hypothetical protein RR419_09275 [Akkermansia sp.]
MNFFEQELRKMFAAAKIFDDVKFVGRACYGTLGNSTRVKLEFVTNGTHEHYVGIRASVLDKTDGKLDSVSLWFADAMQKKISTCGHQSSPYVWTYNGKTEWYAYQPTKADYAKITEAVKEYADLFREQTQEQCMTQQMG